MNSDITIEVSAKSLDAAVKKGIEKLGIEKEDAVWEVLQEARFLRACKIRISKKQTPAEKVEKYVRDMLKLMNFDYDVQVVETEEEIQINLSGEHAGDIIGYRGDVLDAFQYMLNVFAKNIDDHCKRITVDTENYRQKRLETLTKWAKNLENKVVRTGKPVKLEYMNPFERRIIHTALQDSKYCETRSEGEEPRRYIVIVPKKGVRPPRDRFDKGDKNRHKGDRHHRPNGNRGDRQNREYDDETPTKSEEPVVETKKEPTYEGGSLKKLNFVYRSEKKRRRLR